VPDADTPKAWVLGLPDGQPEKVPLARIVEAAGGQDEAENTYYEARRTRTSCALRQRRGGSGGSTCGGYAVCVNGSVTTALEHG
jgi:hypothetical protein